LIIKEPLYLALNEEHPLNKQESISFRELENHSLVLFPTGDRPNFVDKIIELCSSMGFTPDISQVVGDAVTGVALVSAGLGVTIVPKSVTTLKIPNVVYRPFEGSIPAYVDLTSVHRKDDSSAILHAFLAVIEDFKSTWSEQ
jgi:DNA-binding transcriptional LysR family regulator